MWWTNPWWLLALILVGPVMVLGGFSFNYRKQNSSSTVREKPDIATQTYLKRLTILRVAAIIAVVFGLAGTSILFPTQSRQLVILMDVSASVGEVQAARSRNAALRIIQMLQPADRVAVVTFAGRPEKLTSFVKPDDAKLMLESALIQSATPEQTDVQAALRLAYELLKDRNGNRSILLFSDGHPTQGGMVIKVLADIRSAGIEIDTVPVGLSSNSMAVTGLELPEIVHPGERIQIQWRVDTNIPQSLTVLVKLDGQLLYRKSIRISIGENVIPLALTAPNFGIHRVEVAAETVDGKSIPQSSSSGLLQVSGPARILVVHGSSSPALTQALIMQGMQVTDIQIAMLPDTMEGLDSFAAVVLDNVPARYISENQQNLLQSYVAGVLD